VGCKWVEQEIQKKVVWLVMDLKQMKLRVPGIPGRVGQRLVKRVFEWLLLTAFLE